MGSALQLCEDALLEGYGKVDRSRGKTDWLLSRGVHVCRIGIIYPAAAVEGGIGGEASVNTAFSLGERLYARGLDFESIERARIEIGLPQSPCLDGGLRYPKVVACAILALWERGNQKTDTGICYSIILFSYAGIERNC